MSSTFRVHYSVTSLVNGVEKHHDDVTADNPDQAAAIVAGRLKPKPIAIGKVKRVREAA